MRKRRTRAEATIPSPPSPPPTESARSPVWAADPFGRFQWRYWDGQAWTAHVSSWWRQEIDPDFNADESPGE